MTGSTNPLGDDLHTVPEVADHCQVSEKTVRRWIKKGDLEALRLGRLLRITPSAFRRFLWERIWR